MGVPVFLYVTALASIWSAWGSSETRKILCAQAPAYAEVWVWIFVIALLAVAFVSVALARRFERRSARRVGRTYHHGRRSRPTHSPPVVEGTSDAGVMVRCVPGTSLQIDSNQTAIA